VVRFSNGGSRLSVFENVQAGCGAQLAAGALSRGVLELEREADHSPSSVEVKNTWLYTYTPAICLHIAHRGNFLQSESSLVLFRVAFCFSMLLTLTARFGFVKTGHMDWIS
jgi:hypothetical protein